MFYFLFSVVIIKNNRETSYQIIDYISLPLLYGIFKCSSFIYINLIVIIVHNIYMVKLKKIYVVYKYESFKINYT